MLNDLRSQLGTSMQTMRRLLLLPVGGKPADKRAGQQPKVHGAQARDEQKKRERRMRRDLFDLMQLHPGSRLLMAHLDLVERTLRRNGYAAVEALPMPVIAKALTQLERLVWDWTPAGLAELRSRLAVLVKNRPFDPRPAAAAESDLAPHAGTADVTEVDHSVFEEMERSWAGHLPEGIAKAAAEVPR